MKQHYELLFIISSKTDSKSQDTVIKKVIDSIVSAEGAVSHQEKWGNRRLAYEINHDTNGFYVLIEFDMEAEHLIKLDDTLRLMPEILRYLTVSKKVKSEEELAKEKVLREKITAKRMAVAQEKEREEEKIKIKEEPPKAEKPKKKDSKISIDDFDKKLDEILKEEI